jgi:hypothetical protein
VDFPRYRHCQDQGDCRRRESLAHRGPYTGGGGAVATRHPEGSQELIDIDPGRGGGGLFLLEPDSSCCQTLGHPAPWRPWAGSRILTINAFCFSMRLEVASGLHEIASKDDSLNPQD